MYIEYYILENLLINYIIISCTCILTKKYSSFRKKIIGASLGALYSVAYIFQRLDILFTLPLKIIIMTIITLVAFTYKNKKEYMSIILVFYLVNIFISGSTFFIIYFTGINRLKISFLIICAYVSCEILKHIYNDIKTIKHIKEYTKVIQIALFNKEFTCKALLDSGNLLKDPISKSDIVIVKSSALKDVLPNILIDYNYNDIDISKFEEIVNLLEDKVASKIRMIPYKHAGSSKGGIMIGIKVDYLKVDESKIGNIIVGVSNFDDSQYSAILNPSVLQSI